MASAARIHVIERGRDVTAFPLFAFGGAGPVHAHGVARILRSPRVIYPLGAGVTSTVGFLVAPLTFDFVRTLPGGLDDVDWTAVTAAVDEMESEGRAILGRTVPPAQVTFRRYADMRYRKQGYEIRVPIPAGPLDAARRDDVCRAFEDAYRSVYGHTVRATPIDVVSWRVVAMGPRPELALPRAGGTAGTSAENARKGRRRAWVPEGKGFADVAVYDRYALATGVAFEGPAIVEERESTAVIGAGARARVDEWGNLIVELRGAAEGEPSRRILESAQRELARP
jgi:N-methylhydantoinase A